MLGFLMTLFGAGVKTVGKVLDFEDDYKRRENNKIGNDCYLGKNCVERSISTGNPVFRETYDNIDRLVSIDKRGRKTILVDYHAQALTSEYREYIKIARRDKHSAIMRFEDYVKVIELEDLIRIDIGWYHRDKLDVVHKEVKDTFKDEPWGFKFIDVETGQELWLRGNIFIDKNGTYVRKIDSWYTIDDVHMRCKEKGIQIGLHTLNWTPVEEHIDKSYGKFFKLGYEDGHYVRRGIVSYIGYTKIANELLAKEKELLSQ